MDAMNRQGRAAVQGFEAVDNAEIGDLLMGGLGRIAQRLPPALVEGAEELAPLVFL